MTFTKQFLILSLISLSAITVLPAVVLAFNPVSLTAEVYKPEDEQIKDTDTSEINTTEITNMVSSSSDTVTVYFHETGEVKETKLEEYLIGVLAAEVPPSFEMEALKAQAVAARTYILYKKNYLTDKSSHKGADVCTDYKHCKAYISIEKAKEKWGNKTHEYLKRFAQAVSETLGQVAVYENKVINAVFHAASSGRTENSSDVWGGEPVPYLVSTESLGDLNDENYFSTVSYTIDEFKNIIKSYNSNAQFSDDPSQWIGRAEYTTGGSIANMNICGVNIKGTKIRELFSLRSAAFTLSLKGDKFTFEVRGYGHGVGMSQNGAQYLAKQGSTYIDILKWYYKGIEVMDYSAISG